MRYTHKYILLILLLLLPIPFLASEILIKGLSSLAAIICTFYLFVED